MTILVAITGGSGSGKSTLAEGLAAALPDGVANMISEDWYYRDCSLFPNFDPATFDFDDIVIRDHDLLVQHLSRLKIGLAVDAPVYDFATHSRARGVARRVEPAQVLIAEGTHILCTQEVAELFDLRIYLDTPDDVRFIRRLLRDQEHRGRTARSVIDQYLATVRPAHFRFTHLSQDRADLIVSDPSTTVDHPDMEAVATLVRPLLKHPAFAAFQQIDPS
jgi:uridine kinase